MRAPSIHEQHGRHVKAVKLADVLDALHITPAGATQSVSAQFRVASYQAK